MIHYPGFQVAASLPALKNRYQTEFPEYLKWGIHVMVSQNGNGELTIGDSHEYGLVHEPFDKDFINNEYPSVVLKGNNTVVYFDYTTKLKFYVQFIFRII